jgi:hypothetical protein
MAKDVAKEIGVSPRTLSSRWKKLPAFQRAVRADREQLIPAGGVPSAEQVAIAGLSATTRDGRPLWGVRLTAAKILLAAPVASREAQKKAREVFIYLPTPDGGEEDDAEDLDEDLALDAEDEE